MTFSEFTQKKIGDYVKLADIKDNKIYLQQIRNSNLPPFIISFFECSYPEANRFLTKEEFDETLRRVVSFNINYIIKPKQTILKFLFGIVETKPADYIKERLRYFQFYSYYITHILDFIDLNSPLFISSNQVEFLIDEINEKILSEISDPSAGNTKRLNLINLLYYFFIDLVENNPINIKLPKKILSAFFQDKGFEEIQKKVDNFFSEEIFIQEAVELIKPAARKKEEQPQGEEQKDLEKFQEKAKTGLIDTQSSEKDLTIARQTESEKEPAQSEDESRPGLKEPVIGTLKEPSQIPDEPLVEKKIIEEEKGVGDLLAAFGTGEEGKKEPSPEEIKAGIIDTLFCEATYKKRIIKKIFRRDERKFKETVSLLLDTSDWERASTLIEELFKENRVDYFSEEAVKFVDIIHSHFSEEDLPDERIRGNENL